jgi:2-dehydropantoate 2-reductase
MLCLAGADVTLLARGENLSALQRQGLRVHRPGQGVQTVPVRAVDAALAGRNYDLVMVTLKAMQLEPVAQDLVDRLAPQGNLLMIQNGLPWWYFEHQTGPWQQASIPCLDPNGVLARTIPLDRVVGAVIYKPVTSLGPGEILLPPVMPPRLIVGEVDNHLTPRLMQVQQCLTQAGLNTEVTDNIRLAKWQKLMMNLIWNPLCAIMQVSPGHIVADPRARALAEQMIVEGRSIAWACDMPVQVVPEAEIERVSQNFSQTPSMLQDIRAGRPVELDAIVNAVIEIGDMVQVPCPALKTVAGILGVLNQSLVRTQKGVGPR